MQHGGESAGGSSAIISMANISMQRFGKSQRHRIWRRCSRAGSQRWRRWRKQHRGRHICCLKDSRRAKGRVRLLATAPPKASLFSAIGTCAKTKSFRLLSALAFSGGLPAGATG